MCYFERNSIIYHSEKKNSFQKYTYGHLFYILSSCNIQIKFNELLIASKYSKVIC